jgi:alpha-amylase
MGVFLQVFCRNCPAVENQQYTQWTLRHIHASQQAGFTTVRLSVACNAANLFGNSSIGHNPCDSSNLGEYDQRDRIERWFGSRDDLTTFIAAVHVGGLQVYAEIVVTHNNGAEAQQLTLLTDQQGWNVFDPFSGKFPRTRQYQRGKP